MHFIDYLIVATYLLLTLFVGIQQGRRIKDLKDYAVGDYTFSNKILFATVAATAICGGATIGASEKVFSVGIIFIFIWLGQPAYQAIIAEFITPRMARFKGMLSVAEVMGNFYGKHGRVLTGIMSVCYGIGALSAQVYALGHMTKYFMGISEIWGIITGAGIVVAYSTLGGIRSVTITDVIQFSVLIVTIPLICAAGVDKIGGFSALAQAVPADRFEIFNEDIFQNIAIFIAFAIPFMNPPATQRILMAKNWRQAQTSFRWCAGVSVPFFIMVGIIGLTALALNPTLNPNLTIPYLISDILPIGLRGLAISGMIAVVMSSADSCLNSASISFVHDVLEALKIKEFTTESKLLYAKLATLVMGVGSIFVSIASTSITDIILGTLGLWGPVILTPLMAGIFGFVASLRTFWITVATGVISYLVWDYEVESLIGLSALLPSMIAASITFFTLRKLVDKISRTSEEKIAVRSMMPQPNLTLSVHLDRFTQKVMSRKTPFTFFSSFIILNNILPYLLWAGESPQGNVGLSLRVLSSLLCLLVLLKESLLKSAFAKVALWYGTLLLSLPLLSTYGMMTAGLSTFWVFNAVISLLVLMFMVDWKSFLSLSVLGISAGIFLFANFSTQMIAITFSDNNLWLMGYTFSISLLIGAIFAKKLEQMQEKKDQEIKMLAGAIAHEMRTPLTMISLQSHALDQSIKSGDTLTPLMTLPQEIMKVAAQAQNIIDRTLANLSHVSKSHLKPIFVNKAIAKTLANFPYQSGQSQRITWHQGPDAEIMGKTTFLSQVIDNLLKNALYYTEANQGTITLWTSSMETVIRIYCQDTGSGIDEKNLENVFTPFFSERPGGTGVGLAFCKNTIESFGGTITCESEAKNHTTFIIELPKIKTNTKAA